MENSQVKFRQNGACVQNHSVRNPMLYTTICNYKLVFSFIFYFSANNGEDILVSTQSYGTVIQMPSGLLEDYGVTFVPLVGQQRLLLNSERNEKNAATLFSKP